MKKKKALAIFMAIAMVFCYIPVTSFADATTLSGSAFMDMPEEGFWSTVALKAAVNNGLITGFTENSGMYIKPNDPLTRAQMATIVNRAFGANDTASLSGASDVPADAWYYKDMQKAVKMGTMKLDANMRPNDKITRQEAFTILGRALKMDDGSKTDVAKFSDASQIADWAAPAMGAMVKAGYIKGDNNLLNPKANMTRAQFAVVMNNVIKEYITKPGTVTKVSPGNIMVNVAGVTLENVTIDGDLIIGDGVGDVTVTLNNVIVNGSIIIRGGKVETVTDGIPVSSITITGKSNVRKITTLKGTLQMLADVKPTTATNKTIKWSVTNEDGSVTDKATINANGLLTAVQDGKVKVKATSVSTPAVSDDIVIEISGQLLPSTIVFNDAGPIAKTVGDVAFTNKVIGGEGAGAVTYTSGTPATATVNKTTGEVTIIAVGSTVITATKAATATHSETTNTYTINISKKDAIPLEKINPIIGEARVGEELTAGSVYPKEATVTYEWLRIKSGMVEFEYIPGATTNKYTPVSDDVGYYIRVAATGIGNYSGIAVSRNTGAIATNTVVKTDPIVNKAVAATAVNSGQKLEQAILSGTFKNSNGQVINGTLEWENPKIVVTSTGSYGWRFVPNDLDTYNGIHGTLAVTVVASQPSDFAGGSGTASDPYQVATAEQLDNVRNYLDRNFIQTADINLGLAPWNTGEGWVPLGTKVKQFTGKYNGNGKIISELTINRTAEDNQALFGWTGDTAKLSNISLVDVKINGKENIGSLVGNNSGNTEDSYATGSVKGYRIVGGLVGMNIDSGTIYNSYATCLVTGDSNIVGGLVGQHSGIIKGCYATGSVTAYVFAGGLVGSNHAMISNSYATGSVTSKNHAGGLSGSNAGGGGIINSCYATGLVRITGYDNDKDHVAGIVAYNFGKVDKCYYDKDTTARNDKGKGDPKTTAEMKNQKTFKEWDFTDIWKIDANSYPSLQWQK